MGAVLTTLVVLGSFDHRFGGGESGTVSISLAEAFAYVAALLVAFALVAGPPAKRRRILHRLGVRAWSAFTFMAWAAIAGVVALVQGGSIEGLHALKDSMPGLLLFALMCASITNLAALERAQTTMLASVSAMSLLCVSQYLVGGPYLAPVSESAYFKHSFDTIDIVHHPVVGMFGHPNGVAMYFVPALVLSVGLLTKRPGRRVARGRPFLVMVAVLSLCGLALSQAKIAILVGVVSSACVAVLENRGVAYSQRRCLVGFVALASLVAGLIGGLIAFLASRGVAIATGTLITRWYLTILAIEVLRGHPSIALIGGASVSNLDVGTGIAVHNTFIAKALQHGILGAVLYGTIFVQALSSPTREGWTYAFPVLSLMALQLVEPGLGTQMEILVLFYVGLAAVSGVAERPCPQGGDTRSAVPSGAQASAFPTL